MCGVDVATDTGPVLCVRAVTATTLVEHRLLDDLVSLEENRLRNRESQCLRRLLVDHQVELGWPLNREVPGSCSLENLVHVHRCSAGRVSEARRVVHESARRSPSRLGTNEGHAI